MSLPIEDGIDAWVKLTGGDCHSWRQFKEEGKRLVTRGHVRDDIKSGCPFSALRTRGDLHNAEKAALTTHRPEFLPTPPATQEHFMHNPVPNSSRNNNLSPPPSMSGSGSASKCPIRLLDERSPEEIAEYFETHKHEIPRSHEVCVKRYQSNEQSIRQLDAKYGSLVNMLQGLGMKHQPWLPAQEDEKGFAEMDAKSAKKVEQWAGNVPETLDIGNTASENLPKSSGVDAEEREGHFDRLLKEIRVGESPSRPWGIQVPGGVPYKDHAESEAAPTPKGAAPVIAPQAQIHKANEECEGSKNDRMPVVFNGPVFFGYDADQAASFFQKCGWDSPGQSRTNT